MKKLVFSACALTLTGSTVVANDSDWTELDKEIQALSVSLQDIEDTGMTFGGRIRAAFESSGDIQPNGPMGNDLGGFALYNARLYAHGTTVSNIGYRIEYDFAENGVGLGTMNGLLDAYLDIPVGGEIIVRVGQFRAFVLEESQLDTGNIFFFDRSVNAAFFAGRTRGIAVTGNYDAFDFAVSVNNGGDFLGDDYFYAIRGGIDFLGEGTKLMEGAYGAGEEMEASAGIAYFNDDAIDDADGIAVEASIASNVFSARASIVPLGDGLSGSQADLNERIPYIASLNGEGDTTPWQIGGTFMLTQPSSDYGAWEIGARYQDLDDSQSTQVIDIGANYYVDGHNMKYIIGWTNVSSDIDAAEVDLFRVGVNTRF